MAFNVRKGSASFQYAVQSIINQIQQTFVSSQFHNDITCGPTTGSFDAPVVANLQATAANATVTGTYASSITLANQLRAILVQHMGDTLAHNVADATAITAPVATTGPTVITLANDLKAKYNTHRTSASPSQVHANNDATNVVAVANATDETTAVALVNDIKAKVNAHMISGPAVRKLGFISP